MTKSKGKALYKFSHGKVTTDVRYDTVEREFIAKVGDKEFRAPTQAALEDKIRAHVDAAENILWEFGYHVTVTNPNRHIEQSDMSRVSLTFGVHVEKILWTVLSDAVTHGKPSVAWTRQDYVESKRLSRAVYLGVDILPYWSEHSDGTFNAFFAAQSGIYSNLADVVTDLDFYRRIVVAILCSADKSLDAAMSNLDTVHSVVGAALDNANIIAGLPVLFQTVAPIDEDTTDADEYAADVLQNQAVMSGQA